MKPGDLILVRTDHFVSKLIRFGQRSYGKEYAQWNHVAIYVGNDEIVEALTKGVVLSPADKYPIANTKWVPVLPRPTGSGSTTAGVQRNNVVLFARSCVGESYGWLTIVAIALKTLTKGRLSLGLRGTSICSGLAARSLERAGYNFNPYDPAELTPAYLAKNIC